MAQFASPSVAAKTNAARKFGTVLGAGGGGFMLFYAQNYAFLCLRIMLIYARIMLNYAFMLLCSGRVIMLFKMLLCSNVVELPYCSTKV